VRTESSIEPILDTSGSSASLQQPDRSRLIWRAVFPRAAASGLLLAILVTVAGAPLLLVVIPPVCAAIVAVWYARSEKTQVTAGMGARIGAITGFFGFLFQALIFGAIFLAKPSEMKAIFHKQLQEAIARNPNPQAQAMAEKLLTPEGILAVALLGLAMFFVFYLILGSLGGAIGSSFTRKKQT
jgi:hypothetical protein